MSRTFYWGYKCLPSCKNSPKHGLHGSLNRLTVLHAVLPEFCLSPIEVGDRFILTTPISVWQLQPRQHTIWSQFMNLTESSTSLQYSIRSEPVSAFHCMGSSSFLKAVNFECNDVQRLIYSVTKSYCKICVALNCIAQSTVNLSNKSAPPPPGT